jgi:hypothetical protein
VEIPSPLCTYVFFEERARVNFREILISCGSVPTAALDEGDESLESKLLRALKRVASEGFDMERINLMLKRKRLQVCIQSIWVI